MNTQGKKALDKPCNPSFPDFIKEFPLADVVMSGATPYLLSSPHAQVVFYELPPGEEVPPHSHGAQWGIVVEGAMALTIDGESQVYYRGDTYFIPDGAVHTAQVLEDTRTVTVFAEPDRYKER